MDFIKAHGAEMDEGFPIPGWNVEEHLAFMDQAGIETAVLTMPAPQPWFGDGAEAAAFCRKYNEECAALKARYPGRFLFCAALPLTSRLTRPISRPLISALTRKVPPTWSGPSN